MIMIEIALDCMRNHHLSIKVYQSLNLLIPLNGIKGLSKITGMDLGNVIFLSGDLQCCVAVVQRRLHFPLAFCKNHR